MPPLTVQLILRVSAHYERFMMIASTKEANDHMHYILYSHWNRCLH